MLTSPVVSMVSTPGLSYENIKKYESCKNPLGDNLVRLPQFDRRRLLVYQGIHKDEKKGGEIEG